GLSALYVVGVREPGAQRSVADEAASLADLLSERAATDTVALVAQGTPTNNLTDRPSGWSSGGDPYAGYRRLVNPAEPAAELNAGGPALHGGAADGPIPGTAPGLPARAGTRVPAARPAGQRLGRHKP